MQGTPAVVLGIFNSTLVGSNNYASGLNCRAGASQAVANGVSCFAGNDGGSGNVALGSNCNANGIAGDGGVAAAIGSSVSARGNSHAIGGKGVTCLVVGGNPCTAWGQGINIAASQSHAYGSNISITAANCLALGDMTGLPALATANTIRLGRPDQTRLEAGAFVFVGGSVSAYFRQSSDVTVVNTIAESTLVAVATGTMQIGSADFAVGKAIRIKAAGYLSAAAVGPTLQIRVKDDGGNILFDSGIFAVTGTPVNDLWDMEVNLTIRTLGAPGTIKGQGRVLWGNPGSTRLLETVIQTAPANIITTSARTLNVTAQWGTADAANIITCDTLTMEVLG